MTLTLPSGHICLIDDEDFEVVSKYKWHIKRGYAEAWTRDKTPNSLQSIRMHRLIMPHIKGMIDHRNSNRLDNRKQNLRESTKSTNGMNRGKPITNKSGYKGVSWNARVGKWYASIQKEQKSMGLGYYENIENARDAYIKAAKELFGEFASF